MSVPLRSTLFDTGADGDDDDVPYDPPFWGAAYVTVIMSLRGLVANKLRAALTMLGVVIGVAAVIVAIAIGQGSKAAVQASLQRLGTNVLTVRPGSQRRGNISFGFGSRSTLKTADAEAVLKGAPSVGKVSPEVNGNRQIKYGNKNTSVSVNGNGEYYPVISNHPVQSGRYFTASEIRSLARVAVLGSSTAKELFDRASPLNKTIRVGDNNFVVIGVLKEKGGQGFRNPDDGVYVPYTTGLRRVFGQQNIGSISVQARSFTLMRKAQSEVEEIVRRQHKLTGDAASDFIIFNQADLSEAQNAQQDTFGSLITYLAVVSLVVGGIGIMNIMLVSVTERTREIGVRKAIGARKADVLGQFLCESLFLSLVGGALGVLVGVVGSGAIGKANGWLVVVSPTSIILAFGVSAFVGIFFGFYPALKAANLRPIEALRYE
ncbi:MAG: ABC transporter permease [Armatimonadetes bacterium]|nr:ABC transporter permease [Armatimonadota bacterium]